MSLENFLGNEFGLVIIIGVLFGVGMWNFVLDSDSKWYMIFVFALIFTITYYGVKAVTRYLRNR